MDSIAPSAPRLDTVNLPSSYEEAVKMTNRDMTISPKKLNPIQVTLDSGISVRRGFIYKANKSPIIIYKFIELFLQYFTGNIMLQVTGTVPPYSLVFKNDRYT